MKQTDPLYLLLPFAVVIIWTLRRCEFSSKAAAWLLAGTMIVMWATFYVALYTDIFRLTAEEAFADIESAFRDVPADWIWRDAWNRYGPLLVLAYFGLCYSIAWAFRKRTVVRNDNA